MAATAEAGSKKQANVEFFRGNLDKWLKDPLLHHKFVVIQDQEIKGSFDTFDAALRDAVSQFPVEEFVIQQIISQEEIIGFLRWATP